MTLNEPTDPEGSAPGHSDAGSDPSVRQPAAEPPVDPPSPWEYLSTPRVIEPVDQPLYTWPPAQDPLVAMQPAVEPPPRLLPNIGHAAVFGLLGIVTLLTGALTTFLSLMAVEHVSLRTFQAEMTKSVAWAIAAQAVWYVELWIVAILVFGLWWGRSLFKGICWNSNNARRWFLRLAAIGLATGAAITLAGNFVPIPKATPILKDIQTSTASAWVLMIFGITLAPLTEELAFRGFMLPSIINIFRWMQRRRWIGEGTVRGFGIPLSIVLTSAVFALVHSAQVSHAWGPVLLIGLVSVVLCIVRLRTSSVAAGVVVHASYNFLLFAALLYQTDWFRHLDKLKG
jgi:membrane protease YdiL (CAAX protease family)